LKSTAEANVISDAKYKFLERIKTGGPATAVELAKAFGLTTVAVRLHLKELRSRGLVTQSKHPSTGRGRPAMRWSLTEKAGGLFPDHHGELTVGLIQAARRAVGEEGLQRILDARAKDQAESYRQTTAGAMSPADRLKILARRRTAEGYMAHVTANGPRQLFLIEHHCPIREAARQCRGLCAVELEVFRQAMGDDVTVERVEHVLDGGARCIYRVNHVRNVGAAGRKEERRVREPV
jgi:predicted ArsR family transcriptional regulator